MNQFDEVNNKCLDLQIILENENKENLNFKNLVAYLEKQLKKKYVIKLDFINLLFRVKEILLQKIMKNKFYFLKFFFIQLLLNRLKCFQNK